MPTRVHFLPLLLLGERIHVERQLMAAETNDQFAEESWPGIRTDTDILAPLMSLDRTPVASSQSSSKSSNQGRSSSVGSSGDALVCPFCGVPHYSEKSHFQHVDRLGQRIGKLYYGDCVFPENHYSLRHFEGASVGDKMFAFCRQYCSKISSSRSSGIDKDRAAALASWLSSLQLEPQ